MKSDALEQTIQQSFEMLLTECPDVQDVFKERGGLLE